MRNLLLYALLGVLTGCIEAKFGAGVETDFSEPAAVSGVVPAHMSYIDSSTVTVEGECDDGSTVEFSGTGLDSGSDMDTDCLGGVFSITLTFTAGFTAKDFSIVQVDSSDNESDPELFTYERLEFYPVSLSAGSEHTCAMINGNGIRCWGNNDRGQLGNNTTSASNVPVTLSYLSTSSAVNSMSAYDIGAEHGCAVDNLGDIYCWGYQELGRLGNAASAVAPVPGAASASSVPSDVTLISAGGAHTCAITAAGGVLCTGSNADGQLGPSIGDSTVFIDVQQSSASLSSITGISAGLNHTCAIQSNDLVLCWGDNDTGALGNGNSSDSGEPVFAQVSSLSPVSQIANVEAGNGFTCALQNASGGQGVLCWGANDVGQLGNGAASATPSVEAVEVDGLSGVDQITVGLNHACALIDDQVLCWGDNSFGQLGVDDALVTFSDTPLDVVNLTRVVSIAAGDNHTCALTDYGSLFCWGANTRGQLGDASNDDRMVPTLVTFD